MKTVDQILIFDVDGVITNLFEKKITEPQILDFIVRRLEKGKAIALNTGRGLDWTIEKVINPLLQKIKNKTILQNFFAAGEKGGTWLTIDESGKPKIHIDESLSVNLLILNQIKNLIESKYGNSMRVYEAKYTMLSFEMKTGLAVEKYQRIQSHALLEINQFIKQKGLINMLNTDPTKICIDVQDKKAGKELAMKKIFNWLNERGINPQKVITFGDSKSDFEMAKEAKKEGFQTEFVCVGGDNAFNNVQSNIPIINTINKFEKGTLEFLKSLEKKHPAT